MYDECKRSKEIIVCHKFWSILWSIVQVCSLTIEHQVFQNVPSMSISEPFESILLTILPRISILLLWNDGHQCMELILCRFVESSCLPTHNIVPHISWHDPPYCRTTKRFEYFPSMVIFQLLLRKFWIQTRFCICQQDLCLFHIVFEYTPRRHDLEKMLILPNQLLCSGLSTSDQDFVSFQPIWCHPHTQVRRILFHGVRIRIPINRAAIGFSRIAWFSRRTCSNRLSHNSPAKGWPYRFRSRGTTGSSTLDHDLGHFSRVRRIPMSGHSEFWNFQ